MKKLLLLIGTGLLLAGCSASTTPTADTMGTDATADVAPAQTTDTAPSPATVAPVTIQLASVKASGQSGTATFTDMGDGTTKVTLALSGGKFTAAQPAHIHMGKCPTPGAVKYPLTNVVNGMSETTINAPMSSLWSGDMALNVHKSEKEAGVYTACGDLMSTGSAVNPEMMKAESPTPMMSTAPAMQQNY